MGRVGKLDDRHINLLWSSSSCCIHQARRWPHPNSNRKEEKMLEVWNACYQNVSFFFFKKCLLIRFLNNNLPPTGGQWRKRHVQSPPKPKPKQWMPSTFFFRNVAFLQTMVSKWNDLKKSEPNVFFPIRPNFYIVHKKKEFMFFIFVN